MRYLLVVVLSLFLIESVDAQSTEKKERRGLFGRRVKHEHVRDTIHKKVVYRDTVFLLRPFEQHKVIKNLVDDSIPSSFLNQFDYLSSAWYASFSEDAERLTEDYFKKNPPVEYSDSVYLSRLDNLHSAIPLSYNPIVRKYIELYTKRGRLQTARMLGLADYYFPIFEEELDKMGMPLELKYLSVIESALNPVALSKAGACGLWQFMYGTGKLYKLRVDSYIDERRDPIKSTQAAVQYLKDLYAIYDNWMLVIAAYNCGPGTVNKAIHRSGGYKNYWDLYYHLPKETRGYIPAFIGALYSFEYYRKHNILPLESQLPIQCDTLLIEDLLHFEQISNKLDIPMEQLRTLNPQYRVDAIPASEKQNFVLNLPVNYVGGFIEQQDSIFAYNRDKYFNLADRNADPTARLKTHAKAISRGENRIVHVVKAGEVPGAIAKQYNVRLSDLKYWNNLDKRLTIRPGQKLVIYSSKNVAQRNAAAANASEKIAYENLKEGEFFIHKVKKGENVWSISQIYPGVTNKDILKWNHLTEKSSRNLKVGDELKIKRL